MPVESSQEKPLSVSLLTQEIGFQLKDFKKLFVEAEISGWRPNASGHVYFTLKDEGATIGAVMFRTSVEHCRKKGTFAALKEGAKVIVYGDLAIYGPQGRYQLVVHAARPVGEGELMQRYLALKAKFEAEGLFDRARKKPIPFRPRRIALVTSPTGAVVHDMCRVLMRRFPKVEIRLHPASVQGPGSAATLVRALRYFDALVDTDWSPDVLIIARGGGSLEDLFSFNDEELVRTIAAARIPVISAVGHETDFTLCDFVADLRAGTPSMAAELAVPQLGDIRRTLARAQATLTASLNAKYQYFAQRLDFLAAALEAALTRQANDAQKRLDALASRLALAGSGLLGTCDRRSLAISRLSDALGAALKLRLAHAEAELKEKSAKLALLSPYSVLDRGYSLTTDARGVVVKDAAQAPAGTRLTTRLHKGTLISVVQ